MIMGLRLSVIAIAFGTLPSGAAAKPCLPSSKQIEAIRLKAESEGKGKKSPQALSGIGESLRPPASLVITPESSVRLVLLPCRDEDVGLTKQ